MGDYVIVHVGYALSKLDPEEAASTLALRAVFVMASSVPLSALSHPLGHQNVMRQRQRFRLSRSGMVSLSMNKQALSVGKRMVLWMSSSA